MEQKVTAPTDTDPPSVDSDGQVSPLAAVEKAPSPSKQTMFTSLIPVFQAAQDQGQIKTDIKGWRTTLELAADGLDPKKAMSIMVSFLHAVRDHGPNTLNDVTKILADGSREVRNRISFGREGILDFYLDLLFDKEQHIWTADALRLVANTCAEVDENRARALAKPILPFLIKRLGYHGQADSAIVLIYNLCFDYEPGQNAARECRLFPALIAAFAEKTFSHVLLSQVCQMLDFGFEDSGVELCQEDAVLLLCNAIVNLPLDFDDQESLGNAVVALLKYERFQNLIISQDGVFAILAVFLFSYQQTKVTPLNLTTIANLVHQVQGPEKEEKLSALRDELSRRLWDVAELPAFTSKYPLNSDVIQFLVSWLSAGEPQILLCACYVLRTVACSDEASYQMVYQIGLHQLLIAILGRPPDPRVLLEALRFLKNLAIPSRNKEVIAAAGVFYSITPLYTTLDIPTIHCAAVILTRQLLSGDIANVKRFWGVDTHMLGLISLFETTTDLSVKLEIGRTVVEIWRTTHKYAETEGRYPDLSVVKQVVKPVVTMITESNNPSLVTEGWFGLNLIADVGGYQPVYDAFCEEKAFRAFRAAVHSPDKTSKDWENAQLLAEKLGWKPG
ncbi:hypothetical protein MMC28_000597 [Mycoblastus sanguinarius]|nr:hypothetical protein [Mycoblastus sanguinarius]